MAKHSVTGRKSSRKVVINLYRVVAPSHVIFALASSADKAIRLVSKRCGYITNRRAYPVAMTRSKVLD